MRGRRIAWFFGMILVGAVIGLGFGWLMHPIKNTHTASLGLLRADYKADYVLMVAESFHADHNLEQASQRLSLLGGSPERIVTDAQKAAQALGYAPTDLDQIAQLVQALQNANGSTQTPTSGVKP